MHIRLSHPIEEYSHQVWHHPIVGRVLPYPAGLTLRELAMSPQEIDLAHHVIRWPIGCRTRISTI